MRGLLGAILLAALPLLSPQEGGPPGDEPRPGPEADPPVSARTEKKIIGLIRKAVSKDEAAARRAGEELVELGTPAVAYLQQALREERERSYSILYVLDRIYRNDAGKEWEDIPAGADRRGHEGRDYLRARYEEAAQLSGEGKHTLALRILEAILVLEPKIDFETELKTLLDQVKAAVYQMSVLSVVFHTEKEAYEVGALVKVEIRMSNPGRDTVLIPLNDEAQNLGSIGLERRVYSPRGTWERERVDLVLTLPETIELKPGATHTRSFLIDTRPLELGRGGYAAVRVTGRLRPPSLIRGERNLGRLIEIPPIEIPLLARGDGRLAEDPVERLEALLGEDRRLHADREKARKTSAGGGEGAPEALVTVAEATERIGALATDLFPLSFLAARKGIWATNRSLVTSLDEASPACARSAMMALSLLNGKRRALEKGQWLIWWFRVNE